MTAAICISYGAVSQTYVFAELSGSPNINTTGWNLTGNAFTGDTQGDADNFANELILTNASNGQSGGVFYSTPIDPSVCSNWTVEFDYRIWGGSAADGIAFCFLDVAPTGFVSGGGVGIPGTANGLKVVLDTWNNCGGPNPELQIYSGVGYNECAAGIIKLDNSAGNLWFVRNSTYQPVRIVYDNGLITLYVNNQQYLTANFPIGFVGYMGFTASTGGANDQHSVRNVVIYTDQAASEAGSDVAFCPDESDQIGTTSNPLFIYDWSPSIGLSSTSISSPEVTLANTGTTSITQMFTVSTSLASSPGVCPSTDSVFITVHPVHQTTINANICDNDSYSFGGQLLMSSGTYVDSVLSVFGCDSILTLNLNVNSIYFDTMDVEICQNDSYSLGSQILSSNGLYTEVFQSFNGCDSAVSVNLIVHPLPILTCQDTLVCLGDAALLIPAGAENYFWDLNTGTIGGDGSILFTPILNTILELTGVDTNSCESSINVNVNVQELPDIVMLSSDDEICWGDSIQLNTTGGETYLWTHPVFVDNTLSEQVLSPDSTVFIYLEGYDNLGCKNSDSMSVIVFDLPSLSITPDQSICQGESVNIIISGAQWYDWTPSGFGNESQFSPLVSTQYWVTGTDSNNCYDSVQTVVTVHPNPQAGLFADPLLTTSDVPHITFENTSSGGVSYILSTGDGTYYDFFENQIEHSYPYAEGNYLVQLFVVNEFECTDSIEILIQIKGAEIYYVPNTFTPDGDEHNNTFQAIFTSGFDPQNFQMTVYNRWGEEIVKFMDSNHYWDGTFNGTKCAEGTYVWRITYKNPDSGDYKTISGHVNLIR